MKKIFVLTTLVLTSIGAIAQDTYTNYMLTGTADVIGSSRYVGMGGALGALGADLSVMGFNPAGTGLYRKSDISMTFGGLWNKERLIEENRGKATFDQIGFLYSMKTGNATCPFVNFGFNFQKKGNFHYNFLTENHDLNGLSQMDQLAELASYGYGTNYNAAGMALNNIFFDEILMDNSDPDNPKYRYINTYNGEYASYARHSYGSLRAYDINVSTNVKDRAYFGLTIGAEDMSYKGWSNYYEESSRTNQQTNNVEHGDYSLYNDYHITGYGINFKLGAIVRPIENSSFRIGFAVETPTWYRIKNSTYFDLSNQVENTRTETVESFLEYTLRAPWKVRASMGSTIGSLFAWDIDYEYARAKGLHMGYPDYDDWYGSTGSSFASTADRAMNQHTKATLNHQHTLKAGVEFRPVSSFAIRLGYNYISSPYRKTTDFDQFEIDSYAMNFATGTSYMTLGETNIVTFGLGYKYKKFYVDLAYKVRNQSGDFHAFDTNFTKPGSDFAHDNPQMTGRTISATNVDLTRQTITCTLGFKF